MTVNKVNDYTISELLAKAEKERTKEKRIELLRNYNCLALRDILKIGFDDTIHFIFPEGAPDYRKASANTPPSSLRRENRLFKHFLKQNNITKNDISVVKKEKMFIGILEVINPEDAELLILAKDKKLSERHKYLTKKFVQRCFPGLIEE